MKLTKSQRDKAKLRDQLEAKYGEWPANRWGHYMLKRAKDGQEFRIRFNKKSWRLETKSGVKMSSRYYSDPQSWATLDFYVNRILGD